MSWRAYFQDIIIVLITMEELWGGLLGTINYKYKEQLG